MDLPSPVRYPHARLARRGGLLSTGTWRMVPSAGARCFGMPPIPRSVADMTDEVLTIKEIAELLKLAEKTVYSMAQRGELPMFKVRGQWRMHRADFDNWMAEQRRGAERGDERDPEGDKHG